MSVCGAYIFSAPTVKDFQYPNTRTNLGFFNAHIFGSNRNLPTTFH